MNVDERSKQINDFGYEVNRIVSYRYIRSYNEYDWKIEQNESFDLFEHLDRFHISSTITIHSFSVLDFFSFLFNKF